MYNIAYGAVRDPHIKKMLDDPKREEELIEVLKPYS
jgi:hypothetical protein